ncbi:PQQ-like beta-propeller repeat protein [Salinigranum sp. GCM10025319]|uniref:PQQ-like beta-propeller repeat protein n=1 Tax=Salinigranum sp. GCM10025319 TaxID=3252687 RepID=UPI00361A51F4
MPDWSRRTLLRAAGGVGVAGTLGAGWYVAERPHCRPAIDSRWTYRGEHWAPVVETKHGVLAVEGHGVTGGSLYRLAALDPTSGQARWTTVAEGGGFGMPTLDDGRVYVGTGIDTVRAIDAETGRIEWTYDVGGVEEYGGGAWGRPLVADGRIYVGVSHSSDPDADPTESAEFTHRLVALDATDGAERWATDVTTQVWAGPVHVADTVVAGSEDGVLRAFDPETGAVRWRFSLPGALRRRPIVIGDSLTLVTEDGTVASVDVRDGRIRRTQDVLDATTAVERRDDILYVGGESGRVVALAVDPSDSAEWPIEWEYDASVRVGGVAAGEAGTFVVDQSAHLHRVSDGGQRENRVRLIERESENRCGWIPGHHLASGVVLDGRSLYVSSMWWIRSFDVGDV